MFGGEKLKQLENLGMLRILYYIYKNGPQLTTRIQAEIDISNDAYYNSRNRLIDMGFIHREIDKYGTITPFMLTEKGKDVAEQVSNLLKHL